uniref:caldesmon isoform X1 n=1 Tax=Jaculus jaculus TaxID=51337 RepID=UPI001E1B1811|nr:caldesmon isoform X1 [Jaculus jaculus]XP_045016064.1 caldesmon isoform X1 [Jaculus jaculus]
MDDFERRRELRRQKREEMRLEAERIAYQRNDDDEEEAARERRRRARQERLRQKQEEESLGQVTDQVDIHTQNSVPDEEAKPATANTQVEGDEEAALLERLARREERRQKRLQEALERQKEFDPTIADASLSLASRRVQNDTAADETAGKEEKREHRQERCDLEETEPGTKSYQKNDWQNTEQRKKEEKEDEEEQKPKRGIAGENQVEAVGEGQRAEPQEEAVVMVLENGQASAEEPEVEEDRAQGPERVAGHQKAEEEERERAEAERLRLEAEERERLQAEQERKLAEERARMEAEEEAARERDRREAEEEARREEEERRAAEERQRAKAEEEEKARLEEERKKQLEEKRIEMQETKAKGTKVEEKKEGKWVNEKKMQEDKLQTAVLKKQEEEKRAKGQAQRQRSQEDKPTPRSEEIKDEKIKMDREPKEEVKSFLDRKKGFTEVKSQNGEFMTHKLKHTENAFSPSRPGGRPGADKEAEGAPQVEAGKRLEELRRRRGETESEEFEKLRQKQQEAALELEELKKKREERRKVLEEEEQKRKQEEADRKAREEEEKRRLKEEIERRRAEAAEKRQKMPEDGLSDDKKPFKCFTPKGSSLKIEERAEFLNKSVQKSSGIKSTHQAAVVSKIDSRLEQYTSAIEGTKAAKPTKPAASDLPVPAEGVRNIKSMWEKGNVFSSPSASGTPNKETAGLKVGISSRINEWLTKTPDGNKSPAPKPSDLRPGDVSGKRNLWEKQSADKVTSPTKQV